MSNRSIVGIVMMGKRLIVASVVFALASLLIGNQAHGQAYGIELHNNAMPASAGMAGTSLTRPLDNLSAINGNPATLTQYGGTVFTFGGALVEPTYNVTQTSLLPLVGVSPFTARSDAPPSLLGNIGVTHQIDVMGSPVTLGMGFVSNAGLAVDFRPEPNSNGTRASYLALDIVSSVGFNLTPRLSLGGAIYVGTGILEGPFVNISSSQTDYAPRFSLGANYDVGNGTSIGTYWQSRKSHQFDNAVRLMGNFLDLELDHPMNWGIGIANRCLMNGRLLMAADVIYKNWEDADFFDALYEDQWAFSFGSQYLINQRVRFRLGYAYNEDPTRDMVPGNIGGIPLGDVPAVQYIQGQFAAINQHRLAGGFGVTEFIPGVDLDVSVGGAFENEKSFGDTTASVESWFFAFGMTWRRGARNPEFCCPPMGNCCNTVDSYSMPVSAPIDNYSSGPSASAVHVPLGD